jgi:iron complex outermembrane recepter protein
MVRNTHLWLCATAVIAMAAPAAVARAQTAAPASSDGAATETEGLQEIVVTAQRREQDLQSTPLSVAAFSAEELRKQDINNLERFAEQVANISIGDGTGRGRSGAQVSIRGVNEARVSPVLEPGVAIYIDDIYYGRAQLSFLRLFDVERVEVLRGPQGTLFGRNAAGGAIRYIGVKPEFDRVKGYVDGTVGSRERVDLRAAVNVPITDNLAFRVSGGLLTQDGYVTRLGDGVRLGNENTFNVAGKLRWKPTGGVDATLSVDYTKSDTDNGPQKLIDYWRLNGRADTPGANPLVPCVAGTGATSCQFLSTRPLPVGVANWNRYWGGTPLAYNPAIPESLFEVAGLSEVPQVISESLGVSLDLAIDIGSNSVLRSLTGYRTVDQFNNADPDDSLAKTFFGGLNDEGTSFFSQELNFSGSYFNNRLKFTGGVYYSLDKPFRNDIRNDDARRAFGFENERNFALQRTESLGAYAQATFDLTERLGITAGLRYTEDRKTFTASQTVEWDFALAQQAAQLGRPAITPTIVTLPDGSICNTGIPGTICQRVAPLTGGDTFPAWTPRFAIQYQLTDRIMAFVSASRGFKAGGTNDTVNDIDTPFDPEYIWSYEGGIRMELFDRRLRLNGTYFYSDYTGKQITVAAAPFCTNRCTANAGNARLQGFEIESKALLFNSLTLFANIGYLDARWTEIFPIQAGVTLDSVFSRSPRWTVSAGFNHEYRLGGGKAIETQATYSFVDTQEASPQDATTLTVPSRQLVSGRVGLSLGEGDWRISLMCSNCLNEKYITGGAAWAGGTGNTSPAFDFKPDAGVASPNGIAPPGITYVNVGEPRVVSLQVRKRF